MRSLVLPLIPLATTLLLLGCDDTKASHDLALADGKQSISYVREFTQLFPQGKHFISYYTGEYGNPTWNSKAGLHGRYVLTLQTPIPFDATRTKVVSYGQPSFLLVEVSSINRNANGQTEIWYTGNQLQFGKEEWQRVVDQGGDLSILGIKIVPDRPVPG